MEVYFQNDDDDCDDIYDNDYGDNDNQVNGQHEPHGGGGGQDEDGLMLRK